MRIAARMRDIAPFRVMQILARARALEAQGRSVVHMEIGEPDFVSPEPVNRASTAALAAGHTHYTPAAGLPQLRAAIAGYYHDRFGVEVDPTRVLVTPGASGALQLVLGALVERGDQVLVTDPGYPCNRHMISLFGGEPVAIPVDSTNRYAILPDQLAASVGRRTRALMLATPANPTGNCIDNPSLARLNAVLRPTSAVLVCDEIYQGLQYGVPLQTALALQADNVVVINSFSKYFGMTGWRLGWVVAPEWLVEPMERLAQNLFLAAPTLAQHAALAAFDADNLAILEQRRQVFEQRRDFLHRALDELGLDAGPRPDGAFYIYADVGAHTDDSLTFAADLLERMAVAVTPGVDFGAHGASRHVRFAYTTDLSNLERGVERIREFLRAGAG
jgi:aspartate/methionine/tyrosine aminotransferase